MVSKLKTIGVNALITVTCLGPLPSAWGETGAWKRVLDPARNCLFIDKNDVANFFNREREESLEGCQHFLGLILMTIFSGQAFGNVVKDPVEYNRIIEDGYLAFVPNGRDLKDAIRCQILRMVDPRGEPLPLPENPLDDLNHIGLKALVEKHFKFLCHPLVS